MNFVVSVAIITYNHEYYISKAIESALMQSTNFNFDIVIGEDCSTDRTRQICEDFAQKDGRIKLLPSEKNLGASLNFSRTLKSCNGKYIALLEGDDFWTDHLKLQKQVDLLDNNHEFSFCFTDRMIVDDKDILLRERSIPESKRRILSYSDILSGFTPPTQTVLFRAELLDAQILDTMKIVFNGDTLLFGYLSTKGYAGYLNSVTSTYRQHYGGMYSQINHITRLKHKLFTLGKLLEVVDNLKYKKSISKAIGVSLVRLFVLYFKEGQYLESCKILFKIIKLDLEMYSIYFLKGLKLLIINIFRKNYPITD